MTFKTLGPESLPYDTVYGTAIINQLNTVRHCRFMISENSFACLTIDLAQSTH